MTILVFVGTREPDLPAETGVAAVARLLPLRSGSWRNPRSGPRQVCPNFPEHQIEPRLGGADILVCPGAPGESTSRSAGQECPAEAGRDVRLSGAACAKTCPTKNAAPARRFGHTPPLRLRASGMVAVGGVRAQPTSPGRPAASPLHGRRPLCYTRSRESGPCPSNSRVRTNTRT